MIKRIVPSILLWLGMLILLFTTMFLNNSITALVLMVIWALIPFVNFLLNIFAAKKTDVSVASTATVSKNQKAMVTVEMKNTGFLPVIKAYCEIETENRLTGETEKIFLPVSAPSKERTNYSFEIESMFCGYIKIRVKNLYIMDLLGILPVKKKFTAKGGISVFPDTFAPAVYLNISMAEKDDAQQWSQYKKGNDQSELFALREYVQGDSLKQIHWKMSAKKQQLIVKEASLPVEKSMLIFWNKNAQKASPEDMDAMAEVCASVAQEIIHSGVPFTLGWTEENIPMFESIDTEEQLQQVVPRMMKRGFAQENISIPHEEANRYSKIIYIAKSIDETADAFECADKTIMLCSDKNAVENEKIITFCADSYAEDLQFIEL